MKKNLCSVPHIAFSILLILVSVSNLMVVQGYAGGTVSTCDEASLNTALTGGGTVSFACSGTITITSTKEITVDTKILGFNLGVTISGNNNHRIFSVTNAAKLEIEQLALANGSSNSGAAIFNANGIVSLFEVTLTGNVAQNAGGAIANQSDGSVFIFGGTFETNKALKNGGAIQSSGRLSARNVMFIANSVNEDSKRSPSGGLFTGSRLKTESFGGAISNSGHTDIFASTFWRNSGTNGGAIDNSGTMDIVNSTFSGNSAVRGGAIYDSGRHLKISFTTMLQNLVNLDGAGIWTSGDLVNVKNSLIAESMSRLKGESVSDCFFRAGADWNALGTNFYTRDNEFSSISLGACPGFKKVNSALLDMGPLADNGGPTMTHFPSPVGLAVHLGSTDCTNTDGFIVSEDQMEQSRPLTFGFMPTCTIGSVEEFLAEYDSDLGDIDGDGRLTGIDINACFVFLQSGLSGGPTSICDYDVSGVLNSLDICEMVNRVLNIDSANLDSGIRLLPCLQNSTASSQEDGHMASDIPWELFLLGLIPGLILLGSHKRVRILLLLILVSGGFMLSSCAFLFTPGSVALLATVSNQFITISVQNVPNGLSSFAILEDGFKFNSDAIEIRSIQGAGNFQVLGGMIDHVNGEVRVFSSNSFTSPANGPVLIMKIKVKTGYDVSNAWIEWRSGKLQFENGLSKLIPSQLFKTFP